MNNLVRSVLETDFSDVWLEGEISNLRAPGSGHLYCTLKDDASQIRAVIFKPTAMRMRFGLEDGLHVVARGKVTLYEPRGDFQVILEHVEPKGLGALQLAYQQLKAKLAGEGLFDVGRKRTLPVFPRSVGLVTSLSGAALHDMLTVLRRRCPILSVVIAPVQVQGEGAADQIADAIRDMNGLGRVDVLIVGRGGGSWEDLWSFNEEPVVRAIVASRIPVVSAVGHETDVTLADLAADLRAPTPSAAAEAVAPVLSEIVRRLADNRTRCQAVMEQRCDDERRRLNLSLSHLSRLRLRIQEEAQRIDQVLFEMRRVMSARVKLGWMRMVEIRQGLLMRSPESKVRNGLAILPQLINRLQRLMRHALDRRGQLAASRVAQLHHLSPLAVLDRGYSIVQTAPGGRVLRDANQVAVGDNVLARLAKGGVLCTVRQILAEVDFKSTADGL